MSTLGSISVRLGREQQLLRQLNSALIALEAEALGKSSDFGLSADEISKSRQILLDFIIRLRSALDKEPSSMDIQPLIHRLRSGMKPLEDWCNDLDALVKYLQSGNNLQDQDNVLPTLDEILSLLDSEFTEDIKRLYTR